MKSFTKKKHTQKILIGFVILLLFNFIVPNYSRAETDATLIDWAVRPVVFLITSLFDGINNILARAMIGTSLINDIYITGSDGQNFADANEEVSGLPTIIIDENDLFGNYGYPNIQYTPAQIFSGKVAALDINFFRNGDAAGMLGDEADKSIVKVLRDTISGWYSALRNLAIVGLMSVLVYIGIRIVLSSSNADKAKYKQNLIDWLVAMCLIFFLHYIMAFTVTLADSLTAMIANSSGADSIKEINVMIVKGNNIVGGAPSSVDNISELDSYGDITEVETFSTTLMGAARIQVEYKSASMKLGYMVIYIALSFYTIMFTYMYLKRLINMAFLTMIAPLVALTYPIDKIGDSKAQAFSTWLKEYIYNALLQPLHLLLYTVLVTSALSLAATNMIYALVALAFIMPAEKLLRSMFGFKNDKTGPAIGGFTGGMLASKMLGAIGKVGSKGNPSGGGNPGGKVRTANTALPQQKKPGVNALAAANLGGGSGGSGQSSPTASASGGARANAGTTGNTASGAGAANGNGGAGGTNGNGGTTGAAGAAVPEGTNATALPEGANGDANAKPEFSQEDEAYRNYLMDRQEEGSLTPEEEEDLSDLNSRYYSNLLDTGDENAEEQSEETQPEIRMADNEVDTGSEGSQTEPPAEELPPPPTDDTHNNSTGDTDDDDEAPKANLIKGIGRTIGGRFTKPTLGGVAKGMAKGYLRAAAITGAAAVGLAGGITGGSLDDMGKGLAIGAGAGATLGNRTDKLIDNVSDSVVRNSYNSPRDYAKALDRKEAKKMIKDDDARDYFANKFNASGDELNDLMQQASQYRAAGEKDYDSIAQCMKYEKELAKSQPDIYQNMSNKQKITVSQALNTKAGKLSNDTWNDSQKYKSATEQFAKQLQSGGLSERDAKKNADLYMKIMSEVNK